MYQHSVKLFGIHVVLLALMIVCLNRAGDGNGQLFMLVAGALVWPVFGSLRDLFKEVAATMRAG